MTKVIHAAFGGNRFDIAKAQFAARTQFKRTVLFVALQLAENTGAHGSASLKVKELKQLTGYGTGCLNAALQKIVASGLVDRDSSCPWVYTWNPARVAELATVQQHKHPRNENAYSHAHPLNFERWQLVWFEVFERANPVRGVPVVEASTAEKRAKAWEKIHWYGAKQCEIYKRPLEEMSAVICRAYFERKGRVKDEGHYAFSWLAGCLDRDMSIHLQKYFAPKVTTPPPGLPTETREGRAQGAAAVARNSVPMQRAS